MIKKDVILKKFNQLSKLIVEEVSIWVEKVREFPLLKRLKLTKVKPCVLKIKENFVPYFKKSKEVVLGFTKENPKLALFIYACLFSAFSIQFIDKSLALTCLKTEKTGGFYLLADYNPSGWWFLILIAIWLVYMATAGLSLTTDAFEKNLQKARNVLFILLSLSLSSLITLFLNILVGRHSPELLAEKGIYGFSSFTFNVTQTAFPSFAIQSLWAVSMATASFFDKYKKYFYLVAGMVTLSAVFTGQTFLSDAIMGTYIGVIMFFVAQWIVSEQRENTPLISRK